MQRHCCLLSFASEGANSDLSVQLEDLKGRLCTKEGFECLISDSTLDFDSLAASITKLCAQLDAIGGLEHLELFFLTKEIFPTDLDISVLLVALWSVISAAAKSFEVFWIYERESPNQVRWTESFPLLNFKLLSQVQKDLSLRHAVNFPMIGSIRFASPAHDPLIQVLKARAPEAKVLGAVGVDWIRPFLLEEVNVPFEFDFLAKSAASVIPAKQGLLMSIELNSHRAFIFLDPIIKQIKLVHLVYITTIENVFVSNNANSATAKASLAVTNLTPQFVRSRRASSMTTKPATSSLLMDRSISLSDWNATDDLPLSQDAAMESKDGIKKSNKELLKKLILLSLRRLGVKKDDKQFPTIWKHLYCGCVFALRKELCADKVDQSALLRTIKDNIKFLNIGQNI